jgi:hypothetical protein
VGRALFDAGTLAISLVTLVLVTKGRRIPKPAVILAASAVGLAVRGLAP